MKLSCQIAADLLPLYEDGVCSRESRTAVEAHLRTCEACRRLTEKQLPRLEIVSDSEAENGAIKRSFRKLRLRWLTSLLLALFLIPMLILCVGQITRSGVHFTNLHELCIAGAFMKQLQKGEYEAAYGYMNVERLHEEWLDQWFDEETMKELEDDGRRVFCEAAEQLQECGGISHYDYVGIYWDGTSYSVIYSVQVGEEEHQVSLDVSDDGVHYFGCEGSFLSDPLAHFGMWSEYLWQEYEGCYYDPVTKEYIYYED